MQIKTEDFVSLLFGVLAAMPPTGVFCQGVKKLAESNALEDSMKEFMGSWEADKKQLIAELTEKFGSEIDIDELVAEYTQQVEAFLMANELSDEA